MLLRYLKTAIIKKATRTKQANGRYIETLKEVERFVIQEMEIDDTISASIYGANINRMLRVRSPMKKLEAYLNTKVTNKQDNISYYYVFIDAKKYKIVSVNSKGVDLELVTQNESNIVTSSTDVSY